MNAACCESGPLDVQLTRGCLFVFLQDDEYKLNEVDERMANMQDVGRSNWKRPDVPPLDQSHSIGAAGAPTEEPTSPAVLFGRLDSTHSPPPSPSGHHPPPSPRLRVRPVSARAAFQQMDMDYVIGPPHPQLLPRNSPPAVATIRMFGVTSAGNSVCCHVHGFVPYFYAAIPNGFGPDDVDNFRKALNDRTAEATGARQKQPLYVASVEVVRKQTLWGYQREKERPFLKINMVLPTMVTTARSVLERGMTIPGVSNSAVTMPTFESNVLFVLRFMVDCKVRATVGRAAGLGLLCSKQAALTGWVSQPAAQRRRLSACAHAAVPLLPHAHLVPLASRAGERRQLDRDPAQHVAERQQEGLPLPGAPARRPARTSARTQSAAAPLSSSLLPAPCHRHQPSAASAAHKTPDASPPPHLARSLQPTSQMEVDVLFDKLVSHEAIGDWSHLARFRVLSVDIECAGRKGHFPDAKQDPVIQIATFVTVQGERKPAVKNVMVLGSCAPIVGAEVLSFSDEREMLKAWKELVLAADPDWLIGYNIVNFDFPYLLDRAAALGVAEFPFWGRIAGSRVQMKNTVFSSKAYGTRESKEITIEGRVQFDLLQAIQRDHKLSSYSLNSVSAHFLGEQKEDVHHSAISELHAGNEETRRRLAVYCLKDAYLPQRLLDKLCFVYNYTEMARVTGVPLSFLLTRGQSIKVLSQILRKAQQRGLLVPNLPRINVRPRPHVVGGGGGGMHALWAAC